MSSVGTLITHTPTFSSAKRFHIPWTSECWSKFLVDPLRVAASAPDTNTTERFNSNAMHCSTTATPVLSEKTTTFLPAIMSAKTEMPQLATCTRTLTRVPTKNELTECDGQELERHDSLVASEIELRQYLGRGFQIRKVDKSIPRCHGTQTQL